MIQPHPSTIGQVPLMAVVMYMPYVPAPSLVKKVELPYYPAPGKEGTSSPCSTCGSIGSQTNGSTSSSPNPGPTPQNSPQGSLSALPKALRRDSPLALAPATVKKEEGKKPAARTAGLYIDRGTVRMDIDNEAVELLIDLLKKVSMGPKYDVDVDGDIVMTGVSSCTKVTVFGEGDVEMGGVEPHAPSSKLVPGVADDDVEMGGVFSSAGRCWSFDQHQSISVSAY
ncbi:hypothetical protein QBC39DRAFT_365947 [Podospora conica]|nr:hypothetical protein QBC39DRAFT_365947 [Schizothecium conicum]